MKSHPLIRESLLILNLNCFNPLKKTVLAKTMAIVALLFYLGMTAEVFLNLIFNWKGLDSLDVAAQFSGDYQIVTKMFALIFHRKKLAKLLNIIAKVFWPINKYGTALQNEIQSDYWRIQKLFLFTSVSTFLTLLAYFAKPFFSSSRILPLSSYHPKNLNGTLNYEIAYVVQMVLCYGTALPILLGFDFLFISLIVYVVNEFKMIQKGLSLMQIDIESHEDASWQELIPLVDHHNLVLGCIKDLNEIYSVLLLNQFLSSLFCMCTGLLGVITCGFPPDLQQIAKPLSFLVTFSSLPLMYCIAGTFLIAESQRVADAAFEANWWIKTQPRLRRALALVIQRANKTEKLTAGGMFDLNLQSFTSIVRTAFSFATLARALFMQTKP